MNNVECPTVVAIAVPIWLVAYLITNFRNAASSVHSVASIVHKNINYDWEEVEDRISMGAQRMYLYLQWQNIQSLDIHFSFKKKSDIPRVLLIINCK